MRSVGSARKIFLTTLVELGYDFRCGVIGSKVIGVDFVTGFPEFCEFLPAHFNLLAGLFYSQFLFRTSTSVSVKRTIGKR